MKYEAYAVKNKITGLFFGGFDSAGAPVWVPEVHATKLDLQAAKEQALLFASFDIPVQKKPSFLKF